MKIATALRTLTAAALVATSLGVGGAYADQPAPDAQTTVVTEGQTRISTDKASYLVGEPITIRYSLPARGYMRILDYQGETVTTLRSGYRQRTEDSIRGTVSPPVGKECLTLEYSPRPLPATPPDRAALAALTKAPNGPSGQGPAYAETCFDVLEKKPVERLSERVRITIDQITVPYSGDFIGAEGEPRWEIDLSYPGSSAPTLCFPNPDNCSEYGKYSNGAMITPSHNGRPLAWLLAEENGPLPDEITVTVRAYEMDPGQPWKTEPATVTWRRPKDGKPHTERLEVNAASARDLEGVRSGVFIKFEVFQEAKDMTKS
jgi:hypothetical protein